MLVSQRVYTANCRESEAAPATCTGCGRVITDREKHASGCHHNEDGSLVYWRCNDCMLQDALHVTASERYTAKRLGERDSEREDEESCNAPY